MFIPNEFADPGKHLSLFELSHQTEKLLQSIFPPDFLPGCTEGCEINPQVSTTFRILLLQGFIGPSTILAKCSLIEENGLVNVSQIQTKLQETYLYNGFGYRISINVLLS